MNEEEELRIRDGVYISSDLVHMISVFTVADNPWCTSINIDFNGSYMEVDGCAEKHLSVLLHDWVFVGEL